ncbi:hypothetical protein [Flavobacterium panacagri]|uniref:hypothetical protein n=1 Tax=Flavobacterium panacagri TaxID=3034146 RepID=UPI0025A5985A|nr:hypothetical protein [Flavobacterium panacagri]
MRVEKCSNDSNSKRKSFTVYGYVDNKKQVVFGLYDDDSYDFFSFLNPSGEKELQKIDYSNLRPLKLNIRVVQFSDSYNVFYIKRYETAKEAIKSNLMPWIVVEVIFLGSLLLFYFLKLKYK